MHTSQDGIAERSPGNAPRPARAAARRNRSGAALVFVMVVLSVIVMLGGSLIHLASVNAVETGKDIGASQAFWVAEAGLQDVLTLAQKVRRPLSQVGVFGVAARTGTMAIGSYSVDVLDRAGWSNAGNAIKKYTFVSTGRSRSGITRKVSINATIQTFASYMHSSNFEETPAGGNIYFTTGDILEGDIYSNDQLNINGTPRILGMTRSAASDVNYRAGGTAASFEGGLQLNAPRLFFNADEQGNALDYVADVKTFAESGGLALTGDYTFEFLADGRYAYQPSGGGAAVTNALAALNGAIYVNGSATVRGTVKGNVTLAVESNISIAGDIVYASAASPSPYDAGFNDAVVTDSLGLLAKNSVVVQGKSQININASIMVTTGDAGFGAAARAEVFGQPFIRLYGSLSQYRRGIVGYISSGMGFLKNYRYDKRFLNSPPPFFPYSAYVFEQWHQNG